VDLSTAGLHALETDREPETKPAPISAASFKRFEHAFHRTGRQSSALVFDVDQNALPCRARKNLDVTTSPGSASRRER